jgi:hypothetical protein
MELPNAEASAQEIMALWGYLQHRLARIAQDEAANAESAALPDAASLAGVRAFAGAAVPALG